MAKLECDKLMEDLKSSIERLESGEAAKSKELETQLELSNVQKVEFEEKCARYVIMPRFAIKFWRAFFLQLNFKTFCISYK